MKLFDVKALWVILSVGTVFLIDQGKREVVVILLFYLFKAFAQQQEFHLNCSTTQTSPIKFHWKEPVLGLYYKDFGYMRREGRGLTWRPKSGEQDGSCCWDNFLHDLSTSDQLFFTILQFWILQIQDYYLLNTFPFGGTEKKIRTEDTYFSWRNHSKDLEPIAVHFFSKHNMKYPPYQPCFYCFWQLTNHLQELQESIIK